MRVLATPEKGKQDQKRYVWECTRVCGWGLWVSLYSGGGRVSSRATQCLLFATTSPTFTRPHIDAHLCTPAHGSLPHPLTRTLPLATDTSVSVKVNGKTVTLLADVTRPNGEHGLPTVLEACKLAGDPTLHSHEAHPHIAAHFYTPANGSPAHIHTHTYALTPA